MKRMERMREGRLNRRARRGRKWDGIFCRDGEDLQDVLRRSGGVQVQVKV
jgi:hypothetical protein